MNRSPFKSLVTLPAREMIRAPITLLLTASTAVVTLIIPLVIAFQFGDTGRRLVRDGGLGLQLTMGTLLASSCACSLIRRERESGIAAMLLTKPVSRHWYLISRFCGIAMILALFTATTIPATMLAHRAAEAYHPETGFRADYMAALTGLLCLPLACITAAWYNWKRKSSFHAVAMLALPAYLLLACIAAGFYTRGGNVTLAYNLDMDPSIILAALALLWALLIFAAFALTLSTVFPPVSTAILCLTVLFLGFSTPLLLTTGFSPLMALLPNWNWFWLAETMDAGNQQRTLRFLFATLYGALILMATLALGMTLIERVEVPS